MLGFGAAGIAFGGTAASGVEKVLRPLTLNDPTGLSSFLPTGGRFRIYSVVGFLPGRTDAEYRLDVAGLVESPLELTVDALRNDLPQTQMTKDFQCVTGWRVDDVDWQGVRLSELLDRAGADPAATHVRFWSFDGLYTETLTIDQARRDDVIVAHKMLGDDVTREHGGPVRLYVAPMYGYKSIKWLNRIEVTAELDEPTDPGYWEQRGYAVDAWVGDSNGRSDADID